MPNPTATPVRVTEPTLVREGVIDTTPEASEKAIYVADLSNGEKSRLFRAWLRERLVGWKPKDSVKVLIAARHFSDNLITLDDFKGVILAALCPEEANRE